MCMGALLRQVGKFSSRGKLRVVGWGGGGFMLVR